VKTFYAMDMKPDTILPMIPTIQSYTPTSREISFIKI